MDHFDTINFLLIASIAIGFGSYYPKNNGITKQMFRGSNWFWIITIFINLIYYPVGIARMTSGSLDTISQCILFQVAIDVDFFENLFRIFIMLVIYVISYRKRTYLVDVHNKLNEIDQELSILKGTVNFKRIRSRLILVSLVLLSVDLLTFGVYMYNLHSLYGSMHILPYMFVILSNIPLVIFPIFIANFVALVISVRYRFDAINDIFEENCKEFRDMSDDRGLIQEQDVNDIMDIYDRLCDIVDCIDECFSFVLLCLFVHSFIIINGYIFVLYRLFPFSIILIDVRLRCFYWITLIVSVSTHICMVVFAIEFVTVKTTSIVKFVNRTINRCRNRHLEQKLTIFLLQLNNRKLTFTGCNLFQINAPLLFGMMSAIFTYFLILLQFEQADHDCVQFFTEYFDNDSRNFTSWFWD